MELCACPLCGSTRHYALPVADKLYGRCLDCALVFMAPVHRLDDATEKRVYDGHQNEVDDPGYRRFLMRAFGQVLAQIPAPASGLDFGCGPGPALLAMGRESGYQMAGYDKFYADQPALLTRQYDFITSTEVIEHLAEPGAVLTQLWECLKPGGLLVLQTQRVLSDERFRHWRYRHDPTHIVFFADASFHWLAERLGAQLSLPHPDVAVLAKGRTHP